MGITDDELLDLAGLGAFERGYDYFRNGHVGDLDIRGGQTLALVSGTDLYRVQLLHDGTGLDGSCNCPASDGVVFCKHCVATALELRDQLAESGLAMVERFDDRNLKDYLSDQDPETLVSYLLQVLPKDPSLYERLGRQAMLAANCLNAKELKKSITQATPLQDIFEWGRVSAYFRRFEATLRGIVEIADQLPADILLETAVHGINRLNKALERIDDSGGYREHAQAILRELSTGLPFNVLNIVWSCLSGTHGTSSRRHRWITRKRSAMLGWALSIQPSRRVSRRFLRRR